MSDSTARLKLPEIAQMQEMTSAQINDALLQLDALCSPSVLGLFVNDPPASPTDGDIYVTGGAPTGAWAGYAYKVAYCVDGGWRMFTPFNGFLVHRADTGSFAVYRNGQWMGLGAMLAGPEVSIASNATCDLGAAGGLCVQITGTTAITSFGTGANMLRLVRFADSLALAHNAASLILPGEADIITSPGDCATFVSDGSGNWRCRSFARADGRMVNMASPTFTGTLTGPDGSTWSSSGLQQVKKLSVQNNNSNGPVSATVRNAGGGSSAFTSLVIAADDLSNVSLLRFSSGYSGSGLYAPLSSQLVSTGQLAVLTADDAPLLFGSNNVERARITANGSFVVGTTADGGWTGSAKIEVQSGGAQAISSYQTSTNGTAYLARVTNAASRLMDFWYTGAVNVGYISTNGTSTAYNTTSDARLKNVLPEQTDYRAAIKALWVGDFAWKTNGEKAFGVLAQQAYEHMPHHMGVSRPADEEGQWHASAEPFGHLALWGVKDLYRMIDALSARVAALEASHAAG